MMTGSVDTTELIRRTTPSAGGHTGSGAAQSQTVHRQTGSCSSLAGRPAETKRLPDATNGSG